MSIGQPMPESWDPVVNAWSNTTKAEQLKAFIREERSKYEVFPEQKKVFRALRLTPPGKVKVIIIGQDPYHTPEVADGLAFSSGKRGYVPPSLKIIFEEICKEFEHAPTSEIKNADLTSWAEQGVLLINTSLTVRKGQANSHKNKGWESLLETILEVLSKDFRPKVYMLWGAEAQKHEKLINQYTRDPLMTLILKAPHPASEIYKPNGKTFRNSNHFIQCNKWLQQKGLPGINWLSAISG